MASPSTSKGNVSSDPPSSRGSRSGDSRPAFNGPSRPARGRSARTRHGGRGNKSNDTANNNNTSKAGFANDSTASPLAKPTLTVSSTPNSPISSAQPKKSSRRTSAASSTVNTAHSSPVLETPASSSSRSSNRRKRSGTGKGRPVPTLSKINPPPPNDNLLRPGRFRIGPVPHTAPPKDPPPHLSRASDSRPSTSSSINHKDIDALVERVRAVAMAENRPSTPGSHIDWAGDEDDSLPDLDDWGIPTLPQKPQAISPIIVAGLKPLPEPVEAPVYSGTDEPNLTTSSEFQQATDPLRPIDMAEVSTNVNEQQVETNHRHPSLPLKPQVTTSIRIVNEIHKPMASHSQPPNRTRPSEATPSTPAVEHGSQDASSTSEENTVAKAQPNDIDIATNGNEGLGGPSKSSEPALHNSVSLDMGEVGSGGLAESIHAVSAEERVKNDGIGLKDSIHALPDSRSAAFRQGTRPPWAQLPSHGRAQTVDNRSSFSRARGGSRNDAFSSRSPRMGRNMPSPKQHVRNFSSSSTTGTPRPAHSRPVLTGDALSRLAKTISSTTTTPSPRPTATTSEQGST